VYRETTSPYERTKGEQEMGEERLIRMHRNTQEETVGDSGGRASQKVRCETLISTSTSKTDLGEEKREALIERLR